MAMQIFLTALVVFLLMIFISKADLIKSGSNWAVTAGLIVIISVATMFVSTLWHIWQ